MNIIWTVLHALTAISTLPRDLDLGIKYLMMNQQVSSWTKKGWTIHQVFDQVVERHPTKTAIQMEGAAINFKELQEYSLRVANYFHKRSYVKDDIVALFMENHPYYVAVWLGLSRIGVITALLNNALKGEMLEQAVVTATVKPCKAIIASVDLMKEVANLKNSPNILPSPMEFFTIGGSMAEPTMVNLVDLDSELKKDNDLLKPVDQSIVSKLRMNFKMAYVYTSGTTGHPKAAAFSFNRLTFLALSIHKFLNLRNDDVIYTPMPLYHASGGLVGTGQMLLFGNTMVVRKKFSKTNYFSDCKTYKVTVAQYIGEMCSYLYSMDPSPADQDHQVRLMFGNGMRKSLWKDFQKRFNIKRIGEFYGSTEGNTNMINTNNVVGSVGFIPWFSTFLYPVDLIEYDSETGDPRRGKDGLCIQARFKGLLVGGIKKDKAASTFEGYADTEATKKKIIRDVFKKGDAYFNSGDVLERDLFNNYYFVDRLGDTFRWKGENIAASQVETILTKNLHLSPDQVAVYGVMVPNTEGRAGMAAFAMEEGELEIPRLVDVVKKYLPSVQIPLFIRITKSFQKTSTEKIKKADLQKQGYDPAKGSPTDKLYYYNAKKSQYLVITEKEKDDIESGKIKF